jgi:alkyl hydroperoxide reductase subunit AhpC
MFEDKKALEWYHGGEISSAHSAETIKPLFFPKDYVFFAYPRDNTPVCTDELIALQQNLHRFPVEVIAGSTDSPESHSLFFTNEEAFPPEQVLNIEYPVITVKESMITEKGKNELLNKFGYCRRVAVFVKDGKLARTYETSNEKARDIERVIEITNMLYNK